MPVITVRIAKGRPIEKKRALAEAVTKAVADTLGVRTEWVTVLIEEIAVRTGQRVAVCMRISSDRAAVRMA